MRKYGLIGKTLGHSFSKKYFAEKFQSLNLPDCIYENYEIESIDRINQLIIGDKDLLGLNVTIPYKQDVFKWIDSCDAVAKETSVVNTLKISRATDSFKLSGYNTDVAGFTEAIRPHLKPIHKKGLILGTGASAQSVAYAFKMMNIETAFVSRNESQDHYSYRQLSEKILSEYNIVVNTTPLGMFPDTSSFPDIPYQYLDSGHLLFDLVYNPRVSVFLQKGLEQGAVVENGLKMLQVQAEKSWQIWNDPDLK